jgi:uncharacterized coiled-coil DUF342 family protein
MKQINKERREIHEEIASYGIEVEDLLSGSLEECSQKILNIPKKLQELGRKIDQYTHFVIETYQNNESCDTIIYGVRLETDEERDLRIALEQRKNS